ncbi:MAG: 2-hydroxyacid dehydrogenase [Pygmaiobacter sp.]
MNIVLLESLAVSEAELCRLASPLEQAGHHFSFYTDGARANAVLIERAKDADILMVANSPLPEEVVAACTHLKLISVAFTGVDHIPLDYCTAHGITVSNCAGYSTESVAELVFGLIFSLLRRIPACDAAARSEQTKAGLVGFELRGKTLGIVGSGAIGLRVAALGAAFGCRLLCYSRTEKAEAKALGADYVSLKALMERSDIVSLHLPATPATKGLISAELIAKMKPTALLINTARGTVVDSDALAAALREKRIAGAGIDVFETEPPIPASHPLCSAPNTVLTPHVAFASAESMLVRADMAFDTVTSFLAGSPKNVMH